ncbi:CoA ester lyase [Nakamurella sp. YIM 132087]|uniref:CoA ester lyase n=1 Tax=Nakamurella alba TaxID=2665158 RepID=A0A7K1FNU8_9ACTN|nr:aldolase/citrate lyase family protein [Nakamurella alba]MTD15760.1 CoA ester lyase [Nakamurella alba]
MSAAAASEPLSYLYVPGDAPARFAGALTKGADALVLDLEDGVAPAAKEAAVAAVAAFLQQPGGIGEPQIWVRIDPSRIGTDLPLLVHPRLAGLFVPKPEDPRDLLELDVRLSGLESAAGLAEGTVGLVPLIESAAGLLAVAAIARCPRVRRLGMGEADLRAQLRLLPGPDEIELLPARSAVVVAAAAAGLPAPIGSTSTDFRDLDRLAVTTARLRALGFGARTAIHPAQLPVLRATFTPDEAAIAAARALVDEFRRADADGRGAVVGADGTMIDLAVVRAAQTLLGPGR